MNGFYWLIPHVLAGSRKPGLRAWGDSASNALESDLRWMIGQGIGALLTLTEDPLDLAVLDRMGLAHHHIPVIDMTAPTPDQLAEAISFIDAHRCADQPVAVHCLAGQGRTGTVLAAYLIRSGYSPDRAISELRIVCPHAVENTLQVRALAEFASGRVWLS